MSFRLQPTGSEFCLISSRQMSSSWRLGAFKFLPHCYKAAAVIFVVAIRSVLMVSKVKDTGNPSHMAPSGRANAQAPQWGIFHSSQSVSVYLHILTDGQEKVSLGRQHRTRINAAKILMLVKKEFCCVYFFPFLSWFIKNPLLKFNT